MNLNNKKKNKACVLKLLVSKSEYKTHGHTIVIF